MDYHTWPTDHLRASDGAYYSGLGVGRIPTETPAEMKAYVDKVETYLGAGRLGPWTKKIAFVVDDGVEKDATEIVQRFPKNLEVKRIDLKDHPDAQNSPRSVTSQIHDSVDNGTSLLFFIGHGGHANWAHESNFRSKHVAEMRNKEKFPIVVALTCLNGAFDLHLAKDVLVERLLFTADKGAVAVFTSSGKANQGAFLGQSLVDALRDGHRHLEVLQSYGLAGIKENKIQRTMYQVFGDPALVLRAPLQADLDNSGRVDGVDLIVWAASRDSNQQSRADLNGDRQISEKDLDILKNQMGFISR